LDRSNHRVSLDPVPLVLLGDRPQMPRRPNPLAPSRDRRGFPRAARPTRISNWGRIGAPGGDRPKATPKRRGTGSSLTLRWREADSNHRSRKGGHRRLGRLICCSREFPRCRLFRVSGARVLRRTSGRIGVFEKGEFERHSARKEVTAQIWCAGPTRSNSVRRKSTNPGPSAKGKAMGCRSRQALPSRA